MLPAKSITPTPVVRFLLTALAAVVVQLNQDEELIFLQEIAVSPSLSFFFLLTVFNERTLSSHRKI